MQAADTTFADCRLADPTRSPRKRKDFVRTRCRASRRSWGRNWTPASPSASPRAAPAPASAGAPTPVATAPKPPAPTAVAAKPAAPAPRPAAPVPKPPAPKPAAAAPAPAPKPAPGAASVDDARLRDLHAKLQQAKLETKETSVSYEGLAKSIRATEAKLREQHKNRKIDFDVVIKDGKAVVKPIVR